MVPFLKIFAFVLSKLTDRPKESEAFWRLLIWFCRPAGVEETSTTLSANNSRKIWDLFAWRRFLVVPFLSLVGPVECGLCLCLLTVHWYPFVPLAFHVSVWSHPLRFSSGSGRVCGNFPPSVCWSSNWILMSCQPHRVTSGQSNSGQKQMHISKLLSLLTYISTLCQVSLQNQ